MSIVKRWNSTFISINIEFQNSVDICSYFLNDWIYWLRFWNQRESWATKLVPGRKSWFKKASPPQQQHGCTAAQLPQQTYWNATYVCAQAYRGGRQADWRQPLVLNTQNFTTQRFFSILKWSNKKWLLIYIIYELHEQTEQITTCDSNSTVEGPLPVQTQQVFSAPRWRSSSMVWAAPFGWQGKLSPPFMW